jgi:hypothetical protein
MAEALEFNTAGLRQEPRFGAMFLSEPGHELPDVTVAPYSGPEVMNRAMSTGHQIIDSGGQRVGTFTLVGASDKERRYVRNIAIEPEQQGKRLAVATYVGLLAVLGEQGKYLTSDPQHLKEPSHRVWASLEKRGLAQMDTEAGLDVQGFPRYRAEPNRLQHSAISSAERL